jgi:hypothetical protein
VLNSLNPGISVDFDYVAMLLIIVPALLIPAVAAYFIVSPDPRSFRRHAISLCVLIVVGGLATIGVHSILVSNISAHRQAVICWLDAQHGIAVDDDEATDLLAGNTVVAAQNGVLVVIDLHHNAYGDIYPVVIEPN